jgi:hypothetical protein
MHNKKGRAQQLLQSKRAMELPVSFLMLFVSLTLIISTTYFISVEKIQARGQLLNIEVAKQNMLSFDESMGNVKWSPGSSIVQHFEDSGGTLKCHPTSHHINLNVTKDDFQSTIFNDSVGKVIYELPPAEMTVYSFYMKGDERAIINQSTSSTSQLYITPGTPTPEIALTYRPLATIAETGFTQGKPINTLRLYIINLNASESIIAQGEFNLKSTCANTILKVQTHNFTYPITIITVKATSEDTTCEIVLPISSNANGALLKIEILVCNITIQRIPGGA